MSVEDLSLSELKEKAKEKGLKNISKLKKDELLALLNSQADVKTVGNNNAVTSSENGYKLTNEGDEFVEGILEVLPDGYGFLRGEN